MRDPANSWQYEPGESMGANRYALELLGGGRTYEAYLAWDDTLLTLVVVKVLRPNLVNDQPSRRALRRETDIVESLSHPVIVRSFGSDLEGERPYLVLEHLEGPPLAQYISRHGSLALEQLIPLTLQICAALHYLANHQLVHLDVKPRNIILGGPPRLIDLSIARSYERAAALKRPVGTDAYMAPEQCDPGPVPITGAADIWGLGATMYHAVARRLPWPREKDYDPKDPSQRFPQLSRGPDPLPKETPPLLAELIRSCLRVRPADRPTAVELASAMDPLLVGLSKRRILGRPRPSHF